MKKFKVCLAFLMIAMMMGGSAWAFNATDHVKVAPNGKGDLLIFPYYFAYPGDYSTKITVINTSNTHSVVAKVVYRSFNWSYEVLDHLIYLSPNDVWLGELVNVNGIARLQSIDDSILGRAVGGSDAADADFGNITLVDVPLALPACGSVEDANTLGYIEVIEAAAREESVAATGYATGTRVAKRHIWDWYHKFVNPEVQAIYRPINVLTGYQENTFGVGSTLKQANVFADYKNRNKLDFGLPTVIGRGADNSLAELEAAMGKLNIAQPYIAKSNGDSSVHIFNFPTKQSLENLASTCTVYAINPRSPYWLAVNSKCETYTRNIYDLLENTPSDLLESPFSPVKRGSALTMCGEVQFNVQQLLNNAMFTEGWIRYNFGKSAATKNGFTASNEPISYTGTPVLTSVLYWSFTRENPAEANAAYTDGAVSMGRVLPYYQYSN